MGDIRAEMRAEMVEELRRRAERSWPRTHVVTRAVQS
jgi:hypothetical protein